MDTDDFFNIVFGFGKIISILLIEVGITMYAWQEAPISIRIVVIGIILLVDFNILDDSF